MLLDGLQELDRRNSGIDCIGRIPWGTHFCQFYQDIQGLLDVLGPYFHAGLASNEYCLWLTAEPFSVEEARLALANKITDVGSYLDVGQLEIMDYRQWNTADGRFEADRMLQGWNEKLEAARHRGYTGLRLSGDTRWLEPSDWPQFTAYEEELDHRIGQLPMLALCTYRQERWGAAELLDVVSNHAFAVCERGGIWQVSGQNKQTVLPPTAAPISAASSTVVRLTAVTRDFTERQQVEEALLASNERLKLLSDMAARLLATDNSQTLVNELCTAAIAHLNCQAFFNYIVDPPTGQMHLHACSGIATEAMPELALPDIGVAVGGDNYRIVAEDIQHTQDPRTALVKSLGMQAYASHPLLAGERLIGTLSFGTTTRTRFTPDELALMKTVSDQVAIAMARIQAQQALRENEENLRAIMDAVHESIFLFATDGDILALNTTAASRLERILQEVVGHHFSKFVPPQLVESRQARLRDVVVTGKSVRFEDGQNGIIFDHHFYPIFEGDQVKRIAAFSQDITERTRAEALLRASEERFRAAFESAAIGIEQLDLAGHFLLGNAKLAEILGMTLEEIHELTFSHITHPDDLLREQPLLAELLADERPSYTIEKRFLHKDGYPVWVRVTSSLTQGNPQRYLIAIIEDITERKQVEEALRKTAVELSRSNKELEQFAYVASHDLQEPLRAVSGYVTLIEERMKDQLDTKAQQYCEGAIRGAERMQRLITDLLALSRVGTQGKAFAPVDLNTMLDQALQCVSASMLETSAQISHDPLPTVDADAGQIVQLLQNLIGNAIKFCGDHSPQIHIGAQRRDDCWLLSVRDNGIGIEPQYYQRIFLIFQRLHTRTQYSGTGIGLAICQKIIERHGGTIWVESQPGRGSTFFFTIPHRGTQAI